MVETLKTQEPDNFTEQGHVFVQRIKSKLEQNGIKLEPGTEIEAEQLVELVHFLQTEDYVAELDREGIFKTPADRERALSYYLQRWGMGNRIEDMMIVTPAILPHLAPEGAVVRAKIREIEGGGQEKLFYCIEKVNSVGSQ